MAGPEQLTTGLRQSNCCWGWRRIRATKGGSFVHRRGRRRWSEVAVQVWVIVGTEKDKQEEGKQATITDVRCSMPYRVDRTTGRNSESALSGHRPRVVHRRMIPLVLR